MKRSIILSVLIFAFSVTNGFSAGQSTVSQTRDLSGFTKIGFGVAGDLYISFGTEFKVVLEASQELLDEIITEVSNGKLVIKKESWRMNNNQKVVVHITLPELTSLGVSGSGRAEIKNALKADNLNLSVSGSGKIITSDIEVSVLDCSISGSGNIYTGSNGKASKGDISISGSGNYQAENVIIGVAEISISGSGSCTCNVTESLKASVSGSGDITYLGNPKIDARVSGSGKVRSK